MSPSTRIRAKLGLGLFGLRSVTGNLLAVINSPDDLAEYLTMLHWMTRASVPLMTDARQVCELRPFRPYHAHLSEYLATQILAEQHHDSWLLEDIDAIVGRNAETSAKWPTAEIASLVGAQYYWINHHDPIALVGYIAVLENEAPSLELVEALEHRFGSQCLRTMREHASLDLDHCAKLDELLDRFPLTKEAEGVIVYSGLHTAHLCAEAVVRFSERRTGTSEKSINENSRSF